MTHPSTVADTLDAAADLIEPEGKWGQGSWGDRDTCMCAEGAIYAAVGSRPMYCSDLGDRASYFLSLMLPASRGNAIADWNDAPHRTQEQVVAKLREAAAKARGEVQP